MSIAKLHVNLNIFLVLNLILLHSVKKQNKKTIIWHLLV